MSEVNISQSLSQENFVFLKLSVFYESNHTAHCLLVLHSHTHTVTHKQVPCTQQCMLTLRVELIHTRTQRASQTPNTGID